MESGVVTGPIEGNVAPNGPEVPTGGHDLNMPYQGTGEYETPTADMLFTLTPSHTPIQTPLQVEPVGGSTRGGAPGTVADVKTERQTPNMQHQTQWENQRSLDADVNVGGRGRLHTRKESVDLSRQVPDASSGHDSLEDQLTRRLRSDEENALVNFKSEIAAMEFEMQ